LLVFPIRTSIRFFPYLRSSLFDLALAVAPLNQHTCLHANVDIERRRAGLSPARPIPFLPSFSFRDFSPSFVAYLSLSHQRSPINTIARPRIIASYRGPFSLSCLVCDSVPSLRLIRSGMATRAVRLLRSSAIQRASTSGGRAINNRLSATPSRSIVRPRFGVHAGSISLPLPSSNSRADHRSAIQSWRTGTQVLREAPHLRDRSPNPCRDWTCKRSP